MLTKSSISWVGMYYVALNRVILKNSCWTLTVSYVHRILHTVGGLVVVMDVVVVVVIIGITQGHSYRFWGLRGMKLREALQHLVRFHAWWKRNYIFLTHPFEVSFHWGPGGDYFQTVLSLLNLSYATGFQPPGTARLRLDYSSANIFVPICYKDTTVYMCLYEWHALIYLYIHTHSHILLFFVK